MTAIKAIEIEDRHGATLRVVTDAETGQLTAQIHGEFTENELPGVELDEADRKDLRDFLTTAG